MIDILFSGSQASVLPINIEKALKEYIFDLMPEKKEDAGFNTLLSYQIQGGYYAFHENYKKFGMEKVAETIDEIVQLLHIFE